MQTFLKYVSIVGGLIVLYLLLKNPSGTARVVSALSAANTNAIVALQGNVTGFQGVM